MNGWMGQEEKGMNELIDKIYYRILFNIPTSVELYYDEYCYQYHREDNQNQVQLFIIRLTHFLLLHD